MDYSISISLEGCSILVRDGNAVQVTEVVNRSGVDIWWAGLDARGFSFFGTTPASEEGGAIGDWG